jgi:hypothetical protein
LSLLALIASAAVAGCGDSAESPPVDDEVRTQMDAVWTALGSRDGAQACALVLPDARKEIEHPSIGVEVSCKHGVDLLSGDGATAMVAADEFDSAEVTIEGSAAAIRSIDGWCAYMRRVEGSWLLAALPAPPSESPANSCAPS